MKDLTPGTRRVQGTHWPRDASLPVAEIAKRLAHVQRINAAILRMTAESSILHVSPRLLQDIAGGSDAAPLVQPDTLADTLQMWRQVRPAAGLLPRTLW